MDKKHQITRIMIGGNHTREEAERIYNNCEKTRESIGAAFRARSGFPSVKNASILDNK